MKITEVINTRPNAYQGMTGVDFKVEGNPNKISALTKDASQFVVGADIQGEIVTKEKDGRTFYNWQFPRKSTGGGMSDNDRYLMKSASENAWAANTNILLLTKRLEEAGVIKKTGVEYPDDGFNAGDVPF